MPRERWGRVVRYGLPGLLAGLCLSWALTGGGPRATAQVQASEPRPASPAQGGTIALTTGPIGQSPTQWLYLVDTQAQAFAVYRIDPTNPNGAGTVALVGARHYRWDLRLDEYNNHPPEPHAIAEALGATRR